MKLTVEELQKRGPGVQCVVRTPDLIVRGTYTGTAPGKPQGRTAECLDRLVLKQGSIVNYVRVKDVREIEEN